MKTKLKKTICTVSMIGCAFFASQASAAVVFGSTTLDGLVGADPFDSGGTQGNTAREDGSGTFFSATHAADGLWGSGGTRISGSYGLGGPIAALNAQGATIGSGFEVFGNGGDNGLPILTTTVGSLAAGTYDVYLVYMVRSDDFDDADMNGAIGGGSFTTYSHLNDLEMLPGSSVYGLSLAKVGTTGPGVTSIEMDVSSDVRVRGMYIGIGYAAVPEPSSALLLGLGGLCLIRRRRSGTSLKE